MLAIVVKPDLFILTLLQLPIAPIKAKIVSAVKAKIVSALIKAKIVSTVPLI